MARGIFSADWSPKQEIKLLEALEEHGYGNWVSVSLKTGKTPTECKDHYDHYYMDRHHHNLPEFPCGVVEPEWTRNSCLSMEPDQAYYPGTEISGYMPHRGDFAHEAEDDAESIIADLDVEEDQDELTIALTLVAIQIYQSRLQRRAYKRRIVRDYGLLDIHKQNAVDASRLSPHQQRIKMIMRPFLRFMNPTSAAKFLESHFLEEHLCHEIRKLRQYREDGIQTFMGVNLYKRLLSQRKHRKTIQKNLFKNHFSAEENMLYQVLHQGSYKPRKQAPKEHKLLDITYCIGVEKLDEQEKELCSYCRFQPEAYLQFKTQLIAECKKLGKLSLAEARKLLKIDVNKTRKVYDQLITKGLIHSTAIKV